MSIMHNACCSQAQGRGELKEGKRMKGGGGEGGRWRLTFKSASVANFHFFCFHFLQKQMYILKH